MTRERKKKIHPIKAKGKKREDAMNAWNEIKAMPGSNKYKG